MKSNILGIWAHPVLGLNPQFSLNSEKWKFNPRFGIKKGFIWNVLAIIDNRDTYREFDSDIFCFAKVGGAG